MFYAYCYRNYSVTYEDGFTDYEEEQRVHVCSTRALAEARVASWLSDPECFNFSVFEVDPRPGEFAHAYLNHATDLTFDADVKDQVEALLEVPRLERPLVAARRRANNWD